MVLTIVHFFERTALFALQQRDSALWRASTAVMFLNQQSEPLSEGPRAPRESQTRISTARSGSPRGSQATPLASQLAKSKGQRYNLQPDSPLERARRLGAWVICSHRSSRSRTVAFSHILAWHPGHLTASLSPWPVRLRARGLARCRAGWATSRTAGPLEHSDVSLAQSPAVSTKSPPNAAVSQR